MRANHKAIAIYVLTGLLALLFAITGVSKLADVAPSPANFARWGLSMTFMHAIGAAELAGGLALLVPRLTSVVALALIALMFGALRTGLAYGEPLHIVLPAVLVGLLAIVAYARRAPPLKLLRRLLGGRAT